VSAFILPLQRAQICRWEQALSDHIPIFKESLIAQIPVLRTVPDPFKAIQFHEDLTHIFELEVGSSARAKILRAGFLN
jgi:hypothetical protein